MFDLQKLVRKSIADLVPYSSARDEFHGNASVFLDANENPYNNGINRYPDPLQNKLKVQIGQIKNVQAEQTFLGNGSDEAIDLLYRAFCEPAIDNVVAIKPTYGMYKVCADINNVQYKEVLLGDDFNLDVKAILNTINAKTKLVFLCSPNNPTGNSFAKTEILQVLESFKGLVIIDEAYIDFSDKQSFLSCLNDYPNLVVLQTFSKAWGMAGIRLGMAFASSEVIKILNNIKYPYNINILTQEKALNRIRTLIKVEKQVGRIIEERKKLVLELKKISSVQKVYSSDANFVLAQLDNAKSAYNYLINNDIIVRNRSSVALCDECLRITIGTKKENQLLIRALKAYGCNN